MLRHTGFGTVSAIAMICCACTGPAFGNLSFSFYGLRGEVWQEPLGSDLEYITSNAPSSPVSEAINLAIGPSALAATYNLFFDAENILLNAQIQQAIAYADPWESGARGSAAVVITPTTPVQVSVEGAFTYDFTGWDIDGDTYLGLTLEITLIDSQTVLHTVDASPISFPGAGTATLDAFFTLPAGQPYNIGFDSFTYTFRDIDGNTATAQSDITITIQSIPEPASAACLLAATCLLGVRRH